MRKIKTNKAGQIEIHDNGIVKTLQKTTAFNGFSVIKTTALVVKSRKAEKEILAKRETRVSINKKFDRGSRDFARKNQLVVNKIAAAALSAHPTAKIRFSFAENSDSVYVYADFNNKSVYFARISDHAKMHFHASAGDAPEIQQIFNKDAKLSAEFSWWND